MNLKETLDIKNKCTPNKKQQECIDLLKGSIMVLAGPGTGKTFTVIERISHMLDFGIEPEKILCLTFSDAAAQEMKKRLSDKRPLDGMRVNACTYHSFCFDIIQNYPEFFEEYSTFQIINNTAKRSLIRRCIDELDTTYFKTDSGNKYHFAKEILNGIEDIKKNLIEKDEYFYNLENHPQWGGAINDVKAKIKQALNDKKRVLKKDENLLSALEKKVGRARELWGFYECYSNYMHDEGYIDFTDMISLVIKKFKTTPVLLDIISKKYDYFLVDEYQDTNPAQNTLIFNLVDSKEEKNVFVVGDDDQIIYGFQGAQIDNLEIFLRKYPNTKVICLDENMRSTQSILDLSEQVVMQDEKRLENNPEFKKYEIKKHLSAKNPDLYDKNTKPILRIYEDLEHEYSSIADEIETIVSSNPEAAGKIAVLTKSNEELAEFAQLLRARNIPCDLKDGKSIFAVKSSILTIFYLKMLVNPQINSDKIFPLLLSPPFNININDYNDILANSYLHKNRDFISDIYEMKDKNWVEPDKINKFISDYEYLNEVKNSQNIYSLLLEVVNKTGLLEYFANNNSDIEDNISALKKIVCEARDFYNSNKTATLDDFVEYLDDALENNTPILTEKSFPDSNSVKLITLHSSKGREFDYVFIPTLEQGKWESSRDDTIMPKIPLKRVIEEDEKKVLKNSEKLKLLFVGITRAKHKLYLSVPKKIAGKEKLLTTFISSVSDNYLQKEEVLYTKNNYISELVKSIKYEHDYKDDLQNFIRSSFETLSISPSMLNCYLNCPRQFLYNYILKLSSLNGVNDTLSYGNVVHKTIENFSKKSKAQASYLEIQDFLSEFKKQCAMTPFSARSARNEYLQKGEENLTKFYSYLTLTNLNTLYSTELNIETTLGSEIKINGKIDRLELCENGDFIIKDFKTGAAKNKYQIKEGGAYEHYLNQLRFYKLLVEKKFDKKVAQAHLVFVEQFDKNFAMDMNEDDNNLIVDKIKEVHANISSQKFEPTSDDSKCKYCDFKQMCKLNLL